MQWADLLVAHYGHAFTTALAEVAMRELARENTARHDDKGALETAGGSNYGSSRLQGMILEKESGQGLGGNLPRQSAGRAKAMRRAPCSTRSNAAINRSSGGAYVDPFLNTSVEILAHHHAWSRVVGMRFRVPEDKAAA